MENYENKKNVSKPAKEDGDKKSPEQVERERVDGDLIGSLQEYLSEAENKKTKRRMKNKTNWDMQRGDFILDKEEGQSNAVLNKTSKLLEAVVASLREVYQKFEIEVPAGYKNEVYNTENVKRLFKYFIQDSNFEIMCRKGLYVGGLEGQLTAKVVFDSEEQNVKLEIIPFESIYDVKIAKIHEYSLDYFELCELADAKPKVYDVEAVHNLTSLARPDGEVKTDQNVGNVVSDLSPRRKKILINEVWGTVLGADGKVSKDENGKDLKKVVYVVANKTTVIVRPKVIEFEDPFETGHILESPFADHPRAIMDTPSGLTIYQSELFNLMLDAGLNNVHGVKQINGEYLADPTQVEKGIKPGMSLVAKDGTPPDGKILQNLTTGQAPNEVIPFYRILESLITESGYQTETSAGGSVNGSALATELVQSGGAVAKVMENLAETVSTTFMSPVVIKSYACLLENLHLIDEEKIVIAIAIDEKDTERAMRVTKALLALSPKDRIKVGLKAFKVRPVTQLEAVRRLRDLQRYQSFMQSGLSTPQLQDEFMKEYSMTKYLSKFATLLGIDTDEIKLSDQEKQLRDEMAKIRENAMAMAQAGGQPAPQQGGVPSMPAPGANSVDQSQPNDGSGAAG